jgi:hypothetical protein
VSALDVLDKHRAECRECDLFKLCVVGAALLERATNMLAEKLCSPIVIDLGGHRASCRDCTPQRLCPRGREIAEEIGTTYIDAGVRRPTGAPC